jgi:hypothetical protein
MTRARRRLSVFLLYLGYGAALLTIGAGSHFRSLFLALFAVLAALGLTGILLARRGLVHGVLDERQRTVRDQSYYTAYLILGALALLLSGWMLLARLDAIGLPTLAPSQIVLLCGGIILLALTLPSAVMAWTEPDPPEDSGAYNRVKGSSL